jgi:hypothetical protein
MNSANVLQWLKSFINDENIIRVFEGKLFCFVFVQIICMYINKRTS